MEKSGNFILGLKSHGKVTGKRKKGQIQGILIIILVKIRICCFRIITNFLVYASYEMLRFSETVMEKPSLNYGNQGK